MKIGTWILATTIMCSSAFTAEEPLSKSAEEAAVKKEDSRKNDLKVVLEKMFLGENSKMMLNMFAAEAASTLESDKTIDAEQLVDHFSKAFQEDGLFTKFSDPYSIFSDEEIHQLRVVNEMPVYDKFAREGGTIVQANFQTLRDSFKELAKKHSVKKEAVAPSQSEVIEITEENFMKEIEESDKPVVIDVYGNSCPPCRLMEPIFEEISRDYKESIRFAKINFETQSELAKRYDITSLPTLVFIKKGEKTPAMKTSGFTSKKTFEAKISEFLTKQEIAQGPKKE